MQKIGEIFTSHTHADEQIAHVLSDVVEGVFGDLLITSYSTKKDLDGGIKPGEDWFRWIVERVHAANIAVILLTPASIQKPWVLWEAGAVYGAGISSEDKNPRKVRPLVFKLSGNQVPSPFASIQGVHGDQRSGIERFLNDLIDDFTPLMEKDQLVRAGKMLGPSIEIYLNKVKKALLDAPLLPTEATIQEWCERLDNLSNQKRLSEVGYLHDWLNLAFGRSRNGNPIPLDIRLHRRLGNAYLSAKFPDRAAQEFELALELAPRDIFLLRSLGLAYLDSKKREDAAKVISRISELDEDAFNYNIECAALKARLQRENNDLRGAAETYRNALEHNPGSYYLADVLGQTLLGLGEIENARGVYRRAIDIIGRLNEENIWTYSTLATVFLVLKDEACALRCLTEIATLKPEPDQIERIDAGLKRVQKWLGTEYTALDQWRTSMGGQL